MARLADCRSRGGVFCVNTAISNGVIKTLFLNFCSLRERERDTHTHRHTDTQTQTDGRTEREREKQTDRQSDGRTERQTDREMGGAKTVYSSQQSRTSIIGFRSRVPRTNDRGDGGTVRRRGWGETYMWDCRAGKSGDGGRGVGGGWGGGVTAAVTAIDHRYGR